MPKKVSLRHTNKVVPVVLPDPQDEKRARRREEKRIQARPPRNPNNRASVERQSQLLKAFLPSFYTAEKEAQMTAFYERSFEVWILRFPDPEPHILVQEDLLDDSGYRAYINEQRKKWFRDKLRWYAFKFPEAKKDGPAPLKSVWMEEMNIVIQDMMGTLTLPPASSANCEALRAIYESLSIPWKSI